MSRHNTSWVSYSLLLRERFALLSKWRPKMIFPAWVFLEFWDTNECTDCCNTFRCLLPCWQATDCQQCSECLTYQPRAPYESPNYQKRQPHKPCPACNCRPCQEYSPCKSCARCECPRCRDCQACKPCASCECPRCRARPELTPCQSCDCKRFCECPPCRPCKICNCQHCRECVSCKPCPDCKCQPRCECKPCLYCECKPCPDCKCQPRCKNAPCVCCPEDCTCKTCCQNFCGCLGAIYQVQQCPACDCRCPDFCRRQSSMRLRKFLICVVIFSVIGVIGSMYGFIVSFVALDIGPLCRVTQLGEWRHPFHRGNYLNDPNLWNRCMEPENVITWHVRLFSILLVTSAVQLIICVALLFNILLGIFCRDPRCFKGYEQI
ncbi:uncharacterized protein DDB_G0274171-like isoform X2 [Narcine bancroftii]|uniref:uncharacterized protein DDB_G0274171-like isoform X2 n=1 Tax=Narcine bancroftii TaxID=1343680 RepID=UPI0038320894